MTTTITCGIGVVIDSRRSLSRDLPEPETAWRGTKTPSADWGKETSSSRPQPGGEHAQDQQTGQAQGERAPRHPEALTQEGAEDLRQSPRQRCRPVRRRRARPSSRLLRTQALRTRRLAIIGSPRTKRAPPTPERRTRAPERTRAGPTEVSTSMATPRKTYTSGHRRSASRAAPACRRRSWRRRSPRSSNRARRS